jgi:hypothetical protein
VCEAEGHNQTSSDRPTAIAQATKCLATGKRDPTTDAPQVGDVAKNRNLTTRKHNRTNGCIANLLFECNLDYLNAIITFK